MYRFLEFHASCSSLTEKNRCELHLHLWWFYVFQPLDGGLHLLYLTFHHSVQIYQEAIRFFTEFMNASVQTVAFADTSDGLLTVLSLSL